MLLRCFQYIIIVLLFVSFSFAKELQTVSLQLQWLDQFQFAGYYIAKEKGYYKDVGLKLNIKKYNSHLHIIQDLLTHKTTYGIGSSSLIVNHKNNDAIKLLYATFQSSPFVLIAKKDSNITSVQDFKNKRIMINQDAASLASFYAMLYKFKLTKKDFIKQHHTFNVDDLINNKTDIIAAYLSNEPYLLKQKKIDITIFNPKDYGFDFYSDIVFTSNYEITHHPKRTINFINASLKGWKYAFEHIDETVDLIYKKYNPQHKTKDALYYEAKILKQLAYYNTSSIGTIKLSKLQRIIDIYNLLNLNSKNFNLNKLVFKYNDIYNKFTNKELEYLKTKKILTICVKKNWLPYESLDNNGKFIGISADFIALYTKQLGIKTKILHYNNQNDARVALQHQMCDLKPLLAHTTTKTLPYSCTKPYFTDTISLVTRLDQGYIKDLKNLHQTVLLVQGYKKISIYLKQEYPKLKIKLVKNIQTALKMVANDEAFGYVGTSLNSSYWIQKEFSTKLKIVNSFKTIKFGFGIKDSEPILKTIFNKLINNTTQEDKNNIFNRWLATVVEKKVDYTIIIQISVVLFILFIFILYKNFLVAKHNKELKEKIQEALDKAHEKDKQLIAQSRLAQMGEMISMIAHQWRQPLTAISSANISLSLAVQMGKITDQKVLEQTSKINQYLQHLSTTIDDFKNFFKPTQDKEITSFNEIIKETLTIIETSILNNNIKLIQELDSTIVFNTYPNNLKQVLLNLLKNAQDALIEKDIDNKYIKIQTIKNKLIVSDNAGGIDESIIDKIFDPYFTTKDEKNGTGLGLYMSKMIIEEHCNGNLSVKNNQEGAVFIIELIEANKK